MWHSSLTEKNRKDLERVQKSAVKIMLKNNYTNYEEALKILNLESLDDRRSRLCLKFAKNCLKHDRMKKLFPLASNDHKMKKRSAEKFKVHFAHTTDTKSLQYHLCKICCPPKGRAYNRTCKIFCLSVCL